MKPLSIFQYSLGLAVVSPLALACVSVALIFANPTPPNFPLSTLEVARALRGQPVEPRQNEISRTISASPPHASGSQDEYELLLSRALVRELGVAPADVTFQFLDEHRGESNSGAFRTMALTSARFYQDEDHFAPIILGQFRATLSLGGGQFASVSQVAPSESAPWQWGLAKLIGLTLVLLAPIAWAFSSRLTAPIRAFSAAADRVGRGAIEHLEIKGPAEIRIAARAVNDMQNRVSRLVHERTFVIGAIAHDLRTPLSRLAFLLEEAPPDLRARARTEIAEMEYSISTTLDFVHSENAAPTKHEPINLRSLVEGVIDDFADRGHAASFEAQSSPLVIGDSRLLTRLLANLASNALAYAGSVTARVSDDGGFAIVRISDSGPGMSANDLAQAFDPFFRGEPSRSVRTGGMGLGLTIAKSVAKAHGGDVILANAPGGGLVATVTLPLGPQPAQP